MNVLYTAEAVATGDGREGEVRSSDGVLQHRLLAPVALGGRGGAATNPEQLFAAGYAACFHSAVRWLAGQDKVTVEGSSVTARVSIGDDGAGLALSAELIVDLPGVDPAIAGDLVDRAHMTCPYSAATRRNIQVQVLLK